MLGLHSSIRTDIYIYDRKGNAFNSEIEIVHTIITILPGMCQLLTARTVNQVIVQPDQTEGPGTLHITYQSMFCSYIWARHLRVGRGG